LIIRWLDVDAEDAACQAPRRRHVQVVRAAIDSAFTATAQAAGGAAMPVDTVAGWGFVRTARAPCKGARAIDKASTRPPRAAGAWIAWVQPPRMFR